MSLATLRLFKALPIGDQSLGDKQKAEFFQRDANLRTIPKGFVFAPEVLASLGNPSQMDVLITSVDDIYGADPELLNSAFHKSFSKVRDSSMRRLVIEQICHYMTTYGAESLGVYDADRVYIPAERLDVPGIDAETFPLVVIRGLTTDELKVALLGLLSSGVALSEQSVQDCLEVASMVNLSLDEIETVKNREVKVGLYDLYGKVPANPVEFLRYVVYRLTGSTLLIKNDQSIAALKEAVSTHKVLPLFNRYANAHGLDRLGEVFLRFKPLFLALRSDKSLRPTINKIRRAAERNHKPLAPDYLNSVTSLIKQSGDFGGKIGVEFTRLRDELENPNVNIFRKIRLAQALRVRMAPDLDSIVYKVRNGKSFATDFARLSRSQINDATAIYNLVLMQIADSLSTTLADRNIYIPDGVVYGLPSTEKQFVGNFPAGTYVQTAPSEALVAGVYWEDQDGYRVDLDLSVANTGGKIGWDSAYRRGSRGAQVLFSGDNTSAPNGASEVYWFDAALDGSWLMSINYYNFNPNVPVPYKIVVGTADAKDISKNFVIDPNRLLASAPAVIDTHQQNIGLVVADAAGSHRFYLGQVNVGGGISARHGVNAERARRFMQVSLQSAPTLNDVLYYSGATLVDSADQADEGFDLSPAAIDRTTILSLLSV